MPSMPLMTQISEHLEAHKEEYKKWLVDGEQGRIELKILPYLKDIENGFFVEAGALDGLFMSNTKILEDLGWGGILIEPSRKAYEKCVKNRSALIINCALVSKDYPGSSVYGDFWFDGEDGIGAWSGILKNAYGVRAIAEAHAKTLSSILKEQGVKKVDFLSLDVEGYELEALKGIDFSEVEITHILVEVNLKDYSLEEMDKYLGQFGYKNIACLSGFTEGMKGWDGSHQDYLFRYG
jgi:FkbM family methyltransferase